ncbi:anti-phage dCTP deaminase [Labrys neptuniae]|uniref:Anti-phage dCTP deaminase n=1 Tax=Labrys neptuniae TaxID=376174 RepID=A0ABV3PRB8_9HYPH
MAIQTIKIARPSRMAKNDNATSTIEIPATNEERRTSELVVALVGAVGSGVSTTATALAELLEGEFGYSVDTVKVSNIINEKVGLVEHKVVPADDPERIHKLQQAGSALRRRFGEDVLANFCIEHIHSGRDEEDTAKVRRYCTIIDSLKNPGEVDRLRTVYGDLFWLVGVFAPEEVRISRLKAATPNSAYIQLISDQDYDEGTGHGQSVKDTMSLADMFIRNDAPNKVQLQAALEAFLDRIFEVGVSTPNTDETAMFSAASVAMQSACLSRQVGAVIQNQHGDLVGQGANDVPKFDGGLYSSNLLPALDHRCYNWKNRICHNDAEKDAIFDQIAKFARETFKESSEDDVKEFLKKVRKSRVKGLIEFSRAVHAEMAAIVSAARDGLGQVRGATLFTTTFPCHNCARHIVAAGIRKVIYIEPYPKSLALNLHNDAISTNENDEGKKVVFLQYQGAAPRSFSRIFKPNPVRKREGGFVQRSRKTAMPFAAPPVDSLVAREEMELVRLLKEISDGQEA